MLFINSIPLNTTTPATYDFLIRCLAFASLVILSNCALSLTAALLILTICISLFFFKPITSQILQGLTQSISLNQIK